ncbi:hypothetical protein HDU93_000250 [Gonapodya sp. JEL0774]|nr:hypothetical protein HDU93_000250 [Gonapodya sp. JEL0774]
MQNGSGWILQGADFNRPYCLGIAQLVAFGLIETFFPNIIDKNGGLWDNFTGQELDMVVDTIDELLREFLLDDFERHRSTGLTTQIQQTGLYAHGDCTGANRNRVLLQAQRLYPIDKYIFPGNRKMLDLEDIAIQDFEKVIEKDADENVLTEETCVSVAFFAEDQLIAWNPVKFVIYGCDFGNTALANALYRKWKAKYKDMYQKSEFPRAIV